MSGSEADVEATLRQQAEEWFSEGDGPLEQGDILIDFPLEWIVYDEGELLLAGAPRTVVILTQSCDILKDSQHDLLLADIFSMEEAKKVNNDLNSRSGRQALARGQAVAEFLIPPCPGLIDDFSVVFFRRTYVIPKAYVLARTSPPLRLNSPHKEYFSQAFARFMMRVGLPTNIQGFR